MTLPDYPRLLTARSCHATPLGPMHLACTADALAGAWFEPQRHFDPASLAGVPEQPDHPVLQAAAAALDAYFQGQPLAELPLAYAEGTPFQQQVWHWLCGIPHGQTRSYGQIAAALGRPNASRAVGMAVGRNPVSLFVPCHRVLGSQGQLTGYGGGLERKTALLHLEQSQADLL